MVTLDQMKDLLHQFKKEILAEFTATIRNEVITEIEKNWAGRFDDLQDTIDEQKTKIEQLETKMEDPVNHNMRNNLIIKGINESENESVKDKVVHYLQSLDVKGNADYLFNKIERAQR